MHGGVFRHKTCGRRCARLVWRMTGYNRGGLNKTDTFYCPGCNTLTESQYVDCIPIETDIKHMQVEGTKLVQRGTI